MGYNIKKIMRMDLQGAKKVEDKALRLHRQMALAAVCGLCLLMAGIALLAAIVALT